VTKAADGTFFNRVVRKVDRVDQNLNLPKAEFDKMGLGTRDVPACP
jgi:branched-chain amino acid transport system substrate-binding protein